MSDTFTLIGLVEPASPNLVEAFNNWYLGNHIEDVSNAPTVKSARVLKAKKGFMADNAPSPYLAIYELEGENAERAEAALLAYLADPDAWQQRQPNNNSLGIIGAGIYEEIMRF